MYSIKSFFPVKETEIERVLWEILKKVLNTSDDVNSLYCGLLFLEAKLVFSDPMKKAILQSITKKGGIKFVCCV